MNTQYHIIFAFHVCHIGRRRHPELVENAIPIHDNAIVHSEGTVKNSEVCHPRCVFKLHGEVNSVKNTTINTVYG